MKKWLIGALILLLLTVASIYFFIPQNLRITRTVISTGNQLGVFRFLSYPGNWQKWWPGDKKESALLINGYTFSSGSVQFNGLRVLINKDNHTDTSVLHFLALGNDSVKIIWDVVVKTGNDPFRKMAAYLGAKELAGSLTSILVAMKDYTGNAVNIYGSDIKKVKVKNEYMVAVKRSFDHRPTDAEIYSIMGEIRNHMARVKATEEDYPIFNITRVDSSRFELVVGVMVTEPTPDSGQFLLKKLLKNGNLLTAEVVGGHSSVDEAMRQFELYVDDHHYQVVALPFQSFITDRMKNPDTTKWVTRIGYPIL